MSTDLAVIEAALKAATPGPWDEEWRQVPGQDLYEVSDHGNVRSWRAQTRKAGGALRAETPHMMAAHNSRRDGKGYLSVGLPRPGGGYATHQIHRLVMAAFVGPRPPGLEIAHLNGNPRDNRLVNLRYVTHAENESHKLSHGTRASGERVNGSRLLGWQVAEIRYLASKGVTQAKIANLFDMTSGHASDIITGRIWPDTVERDTASPAWLAELVERVKVAEDHLRDLAEDGQQHRNRALAAEAAIERVRASVADHPGSAWDSGIKLRADILRALDGDATRCTSDITLRDEEHRLCRCTLTEGHAGVHDDGAGTTWTGGEA